MAGFIARRLIAALLVLVLTSMIVFVLFYKGPRDPAQSLCDARGRCTPAKLEAITASMGLDRPVYEAYGQWAKGLVAGRTIEFSEAETYDCSAPCLGVSYNTRALVSDELKKKYPATLSLALGGSVIYLVVGVLIGVLAARYRGSIADRVLVGSTLVVSAIPYYVVALMAWIFLTQKISIFPSTSYTPLTENPVAWAGGLLLPWLVLGLTNATAYSRFTRGQMLETISEDYIRTAVAKGQRSRVVVFKHGLRAAIVPVVTIFGLDLGALLGGTVFTEYIFDIDGIGNWGLRAIIGSPPNIPVVTATVLVAAFFVIFANLVVDIIYSFLDPRVKLA